jgi:hypothetical protein
MFPSGPCRTNIPDWDPQWHGCILIDLPTGQISYHYHDREATCSASLPSYDGVWDGHSKEDVHKRLADLKTYEWMGMRSGDAIR